MTRIATLIIQNIIIIKFKVKEIINTLLYLIFAYLISLVCAHILLEFTYIQFYLH
jgi:hypothetical protein